MQDLALVLVLAALGGLLWVQIQRRHGGSFLPAPQPRAARPAAGPAQAAAARSSSAGPEAARQTAGELPAALRPQAAPGRRPAPAPPAAAQAEPEGAAAARAREERRKHRRLTLDQSILVTPFAESERMAHCCDVSQGGMRLRAVGFSPREGDLLRVTFNVGGRSVGAVGRVVRTKSLDAITLEVSIEFARIDPWGEQLLEEALAAQG
jgi:hypothetical protein